MREIDRLRMAVLRSDATDREIDQFVESLVAPLRMGPGGFEDASSVLGVLSDTPRPALREAVEGTVLGPRASDDA